MAFISPDKHSLLRGWSAKALLPALTCGFLLRTAAFAAGSPTVPRVASIHGKTVTITVPAGYERVTVQALTPVKKKAGRAQRPVWKTVDVRFPANGELTFTVALDRRTPARQIRVRGNKRSELPEGLATGVTNFAPDSAATSQGAAEPSQLLTLDDAKTSAALSLSSSATTSSFTGSSLAVSAVTGAGAAVARDVAEADIWKIDGDRLYFFNQLRGLQVFDVHNPADPLMVGTLRMPAVGEDMYVPGNGKVVLIKRSTGWAWGWPGWGGDVIVNNRLTLSGDASTSVTNNLTTSVSKSLTTSASANLSVSSAMSVGTIGFLMPMQPPTKGEIVTVDATGKPTEVARIEFEGTLRESRMVGSVLYLASDVYKPGTNDSPAQWGCQISSFDLSDAAHPALRDTVFLGGWANAVMATDRYLVVSKWGNSGDSLVNVIDISAPGGAMVRGGEFSVAGYVDSKFKLHVEGTTLSVVSGLWRYSTEGRWQSVSKVTCLSLADPQKPSQLGVVEFGEGETVRAARFDLDRAYVVTFFQIDPLWVIDLKNPAAPVVSGHVEAPGFSTYIEPLGNRLVTMGLVNWQPAVSLFDVSEASKPKLLSQLTFNNKNVQWSEATWNEKAFSVLPESNLILLPVSGYSAEEGWASRVQIVDLLEDRLVARGVINCGLTPRRSTLVGKSVVSISPTRLVTVDASNRDQPRLQADIEIAWSTERVIAVGNYLIEVGPGSASGKPTLTVTPATDPEQSLQTVELGAAGTVVGTSVHEGFLYVLQQTSASATDNGKFSMSAFDIGKLPAILRTGVTSVADVLPEPTWYYWPGFEALWPNADTLVWAGKGGYNYWWQPVWVDPKPYLSWEWEWVASAVEGAESWDGVYVKKEKTVDPAGYWSTEWAYGRSAVLYAFDVSRPRRPLYLSGLELGDSQARDFARPFAANGSVFVSYKDLGNLLPGSAYTPQADQFYRADGFEPVVAGPRKGRHFLEIIDYKTPAAPFIYGDDINLPGTLAGVSRGGTLLYTVGQTAVGDGSTVKFALQASAFDGIESHLLDSMPLQSAEQPFVLTGETLVVLTPEAASKWVVSDSQTGAGTYEANPAKSLLSTWTVSPQGRFTQLGKISLAHEGRLSVFGSLAVASNAYSWAWMRFGSFNLTGNDGGLHLVDVFDPLSPADLGIHAPDSRYAPDLSFAGSDGRRALWIPLGDYGVQSVKASNAAP